MPLTIVNTVAVQYTTKSKLSAPSSQWQGHCSWLNDAGGQMEMTIFRSCGSGDADVTARQSCVS